MGNKKPARADIASALFTTTQQRVFKILFEDPSRGFFASEIIERARVGSGAVQRELARLVECGIVATRLMGRRRHFSADVSSPVYEELRSIVSKTAGIPEAVRGALSVLAKRIRYAALFGSIARGDSRGDSDVDVLIVADELPLEDVYSSLEKAETQLRRKINPTLYSTKEFAQRIEQENPFVSKVLAGATIPILGSMDAVDAIGESREGRPAQGRAGRPSGNRRIDPLRYRAPGRRKTRNVER
jgi:predicted nucleotidyltransferase